MGKGNHKAGKVAKTVTVTNKKGTTFQKTVYVKPETTKTITKKDLSPTQTCVYCDRTNSELVDYKGAKVHKFCKTSFDNLSESFSEATRDENIVRWNSNGVVPMQDALETALRAGWIDQDEFDASSKAREEETKAFLEAYRNNPPELTAEDRAEMQASFGPGEKVVNIITGQEYDL